MNKQESNTSFHLKGESTKTGKLPVSEQYLEGNPGSDRTIKKSDRYINRRSDRDSHSSFKSGANFCK